MNGKRQWGFLAAVLLIAALGPPAKAELRAVHRPGRPLWSFPRPTGSSERSRSPGAIRDLRQCVLRIRRDQSLPAFGHCSLDASPGDGDHADAEQSGGINLHQRWDPETIVDQSSRWEMTMYLQERCGAASATMTVTPRRCQRFKAQPGEHFSWTLTEGETTVSKGTTVADQWGLVTAEGIELTKQPRRLTITASQSDK